MTIPAYAIPLHEDLNGHQFPPHVTPRCMECGGSIWYDDSIIHVDDSLAHDGCVYSCRACGDHVLSSAVYWASDRYTSNAFCEGCADMHTLCCERCDDRFTNAALNSDGHCRSCANEIAHARRAEVIGPYHNSARRASTMPLPSDWTRAHGSRFFGVELEVEQHTDSADELHIIARHMLDVANASRRELWAEHDGSLSNGFELITQPMGLDSHANLWPRVLSCSAARELRSHDTDTCGLHVHVTRAGLTKLQIAKAAVFLNMRENETLIRAVARRYGNSYCTVRTKKLGTAADSYERYEMLNLTNSRTIEFRLFRGTLRAETVLACVEFANAVLEFARVASCDDLSTRAFLAFVYDAANASDTKHLRRYFARRIVVRPAPRYEGLRAIIETITGAPMRAPRTNETTTRWAEI